MEDLAKNYFAMSALEFLQSFPLQRKYMLFTLGVTETSNLEAIMFNLADLKPFLPHHIAFQIVVEYTTKSLT